jgi:hypothetical protein
MMRRRLTFLLLFVALGACGGKQALAPAEAPSDMAALQAWWQKAAGETAFEAAPGLPVPQADLDFLLAQGVPEAEARERVALRKRLAVLAVQEGLADDFAVHSAFRRALAQRLVKRTFEEEHTPETVPDETWKEIYNDRYVFPRFDHKDTFFVLDVQLICCKGKAKQCENDVPTHYCLQDYEPMAHALHQALLETRFTDLEDLKLKFSGVKARFPDARYQEYSFQYDFNAPESEKKIQFTKIASAVAEGARATPVGKLSEPVRSQFGWHILLVKDFLPEIHLPFDDASVKPQLIRDFYDMVVRRDVVVFLGETYQKGEVEFFEAAMREVDWAQVTGLK